MSEEKKYTGEERLLAAIAHGTSVTFGVGIIAGIILYITQREKSRFVAYQALQAAAYQLAIVLITVVMWICWTVLYMASLIPIIGMTESSNEPPPIFWVSMFSWLLPCIVMMFMGGYGLWGGLRTFQGKDFRYVGIGPALERIGLWNEDLAE